MSESKDSCDDLFYGIYAGSPQQWELFPGSPKRWKFYHKWNTIYTIAPFPHPQLTELREKYTYNITPFTAAMSTGQRPGKKMNIFSDDDDLDDDDFADQINCFTGIFPMQPQVSPSRNKPLGESDKSHSNSAFDMTKVSPGAYAAQPEALPTSSSAYAERMTMDISMLKKQYKKLRERQQQAHIILTSASAKHNAGKMASAPPPAPNKKSPKKQGAKDIVKMNTPILAPSTLAPPIESPVAVNHLFIGHKSNKRNRHVAEAPRIAPIFPKSSLVSAQHPAASDTPSHAMSKSGLNKGNVEAKTPSPKHRSPEKHNNGAESIALEDNESVADGMITPKKTERSLSDGQSSDGYMSEASNNTRGSTAQTIDLESDTDTIGEKDNVEVSDVANMQDVEDDKELTNLGDKESKDCDQLINEIDDIIDRSDNEHSDVCHEKEIAFPDSNSNYDLHSEKILQNSVNSSPVKNAHTTSNGVSDEGEDKVLDAYQDSCTMNILENGSSNSNNNNIALKLSVSHATEQIEKASPYNHEKATTPTDTSITSSEPQSPNSSSSNVSTNLKSVEHWGTDVAKITHENTNKLQFEDTNVPNDTSPTHSFQNNLESYLNSKQSIASGKTSPSAMKSFRPFQNRPMINERRAQNGIRLGLYSPEDISQQNAKKIAGNCDRFVSSIGRAQINACLHRQYMVEVKQQAKNRKH